MTLLGFAAVCISVVGGLATLIAYGMVHDRRARAEARKPGASLRESIRRCPVCSGDISGHVWRKLFLFVDPTQLQKDDIDRAVHASRWETFAGHWRFDPLRDAFGYSLLECPNGGAGLYRFDDPYELMMSTSISLTRCLDAREVDRVRETLPGYVTTIA
jgi:hypothetical protein